MAWSEAELETIDAEPSLVLSAGDTDEEVEVGFVIVDGSIYVRAYSGTDSVWFQAARDAGTGRVEIGSDTYEVTFAVASASADEVAAIDAAYVEKFGGMASIANSRDARAATLLIDSAS
jgi:hypothetical protein